MKKNQSKIHRISQFFDYSIDPDSLKRWALISVLLILFALFSGLIAVDFRRDFVHIRQLITRINPAEEHIEELIEQNEALKKEIELLKNKKAYLEHRARKDLGMVYPNEKIYYFTKTDNKTRDNDSGKQKE